MNTLSQGGWETLKKDWGTKSKKSQRERISIANVYRVFIYVDVRSECTIRKGKICPTLQLKAGKYFHSITVIESFFIHNRPEATCSSVPFQFQRGRNDSGWSKPGALFRYDRLLRSHKGNAFLAGAFYSSYHQWSLRDSWQTESEVGQNVILKLLVNVYCVWWMCSHWRVRGKTLLKELREKMFLLFSPEDRNKYMMLWL